MKMVLVKSYEHFSEVMLNMNDHHYIHSVGRFMSY